jgi:ribosomal-protein-alanine N-acetyltransferase
MLSTPAPVLDTARLRLRPYELADLDAMAEMFGDPDVTAFTFLGRRDRQQTAAVLEGYMSFLAEHGYGMLAILDRATGAYLGEVGLFVSPMGPLALRYALSKAAWGKGYAAEASAAVLDDCFDRLGLDQLLAGVKPENKASVRVMEKLGFAFERSVTDSGHSFGLYSMSREAWKRDQRLGTGP